MFFLNRFVILPASQVFPNNYVSNKEFLLLIDMHKRQKLPPYQRKKTSKTVNYFKMSINATMLDLPNGMEPLEHQVAGCIHFYIYIYTYHNKLISIKVIRFKLATEL